MNTSAISASVAMKALQNKLDVIGNNIANVNTAGFKKKEVAFNDVLNTVIDQPKGFKHGSRMTPLGVPNGFGSRVSKITTSWTQGSIKDTGEPFDLAIDGNGMFEVGKPDPTNPGSFTPLWTRDGSFKVALNPNDTQNIYLANATGNLLMDTSGQPIKIPKDNRVLITQDGNVIVSSMDKTGSNVSPNIGQIKMVKINRPESLIQVGDNLFDIPSGVSNANGEILGAITFGTDQIGVKQGSVEQSNVDLATEMTELMNVQRAFQLNSKALLSADSMANMANNLRG